MTHQLLLNIPDSLYQVLLKTAQEKGETLENLALKCLNEAKNKLETDPLDKFIGAFNSNNSDWLENHDYYLGKTNLEETNNK